MLASGVAVYDSMTHLARKHSYHTHTYTDTHTHIHTYIHRYIEHTYTQHYLKETSMSNNWMWRLHRHQNEIIWQTLIFTWMKQIPGIDPPHTTDLTQQTNTQTSSRCTARSRIVCDTVWMLKANNLNIEHGANMVHHTYKHIHIHNCHTRIHPHTNSKCCGCKHAQHAHCPTHTNCPTHTHTHAQCPTHAHCHTHAHCPTHTHTHRSNHHKYKWTRTLTLQTKHEDMDRCRILHSRGYLPNNKSSSKGPDLMLNCRRCHAWKRSVVWSWWTRRYSMCSIYKLLLRSLSLLLWLISLISSLVRMISCICVCVCVCVSVCICLYTCVQSTQPLNWNTHSHTHTHTLSLTRNRRSKHRQPQEGPIIQNVLKALS